MADVFMQFTQERGTAIDLMLVRDETFEQFWTASEERTAMGVLVRVPSLDHLIALNLHALKQQLAHRTFKDADDVGSLVRMNKLDLQSPRYEQLFLKYGTREITKYSSDSPVADRVLGPNFDFELPDWNAKDRTPPRLTMDEYIQWIESLRQRGVLKSPTAEERLAEKVDVEFVLSRKRGVAFLVQPIFAGVRRMTLHLRDLGYTANPKRVRRLQQLHRVRHRR